MSSGFTYRRTRSLRLRTEALTNRPARTSLQPVQDDAALAAVGLQPVSEVIGMTAGMVSTTGFWAAGNIGDDPHGRTYTSSTYSMSVGVPPKITQLKRGYRTALERLREEAAAVGADGVVGVQLSRTKVESTEFPELHDFTAVGTAVRGAGHRHTDQSFVTHLTGAETAAVIRAGWVPIELLVEVCLAIRVVDAWSRRQQRRRAPSGEIDAYTDLISTCRHQARVDFAAAARRTGADGAVLTELTLDFVPHRSSGHCEALVTLSGTALAAFRPPQRDIADPLPILRLSTKGERL